MAPDSIEALEEEEDPRYITSDHADSTRRSFGASRRSSGKISLDAEYHQNFCPPFRSDENGKIECTIIPRQIRDAASRCGLKPLYVHTSFNGPKVDGVAKSLGVADLYLPGGEEETEEITSQYYVEGDGYDSAEDMSIDEEENSPSY